MAGRTRSRRSSTRSRRSTSKKGTLFGRPRSSVVKRPGAFSAKAKRAGMSTSSYATKVLRKGSRASTTTKRQASLAKSFSKMRKK